MSSHKIISQDADGKFVSREVNEDEFQATIDRQLETVSLKRDDESTDEWRKRVISIVRKREGK